MTELSIESLRDGDAEAAFELRRLAFGARRAFDPEAPRLAPGREVAAYDGDRPVGTVITLPFEQNFGGRPVRCGGVSGVTVAPDRRGLGAARAMLTEALHRMVARGEVVSSLYPTTSALYRSVGYETGGWSQRLAVPVTALPAAADRGITWDPAGCDDPAVRAIFERTAAGRDGWILPDDRWWSWFRHMDAKRDPKGWWWLGRRDGEPVAALGYHYATPASSAHGYDLEVDLLGGVDGDAIADALAMLGGNGTLGGNAITRTPAHLLAVHLDHVQRVKVDDSWPYMVRLVDVAGAMTARGWPPGTDLELHLDVTDPVLDANHGRFVLRVEDGKASCEEGGTGAIAVSVSDLAAIYAGAVDPQDLAAAGRLRGVDDDQLVRTRAAFATRPTAQIFF
ncbi:MAG: GNAT family N-acetyltransferase [Actinomycetota bacterium]|nr:GNAT family N-acetyltransferase [Actinomycetota bacterium]